MRTFPVFPSSKKNLENRSTVLIHLARFSTSFFIDHSSCLTWQMQQPLSQPSVRWDFCHLFFSDVAFGVICRLLGYSGLNKFFITFVHLRGHRLSVVNEVSGHLYHIGHQRVILYKLAGPHGCCAQITPSFESMTNS